MKNMGPIDFCSLKPLELRCPVDWFDFRKLLANQTKKRQKKCWQPSLGWWNVSGYEKSCRAVAVTSHWWIHPVPSWRKVEKKLAGSTWHLWGSLLTEFLHFPLHAILQRLWLCHALPSAWNDFFVSPWLNPTYSSRLSSSILFYLS